MTRITEAQLRNAKLYERALGGDPYAQLKIAESVAAGEFPTQITPLVRRQLRTIYEETPQQHQIFTTRTTVQAIDVEEEWNVARFDNQDNIPDVNHGDRFIRGGLPRLLPREKYPQIGMSGSGKKISASKLGEAFGIDWESIVKLRGTNINLIDEAVATFGRNASNQEEIDVALNLVTGAGVNTAALGVGNGGAVAITGNPDLSNPETLQLAIREALEATVEGNAVDYTRYALVTTPSYAPYARQTLASKVVRRVPARTGSASANTGTEWEETLDFGAEVTVIGWKWLKTIFPTIGRGWFLIPIAEAGDLPVLTSNYLDGDEQPSFWVKDSNARVYGSQSEVPVLSQGDFDSDAIETKVRHVHGSDALWTSGIRFSLGTNT